MLISNSSWLILLWNILCVGKICFSLIFVLTGILQIIIVSSEPICFFFSSSILLIIHSHLTRTVQHNLKATLVELHLHKYFQMCNCSFSSWLLKWNNDMQQAWFGTDFHWGRTKTRHHFVCFLLCRHPHLLCATARTIDVLLFFTVTYIHHSHFLSFSQCISLRPDKISNILWTKYFSFCSLAKKKKTI